MEARLKRRMRDVFWDGFKSLNFPTLKIASSYSLTDISLGSVRADYRNSTKEIKKEFSKIDRRATAEK
ncbi:hypothetical protein JDW15_09345 [Aerococcaceae bacterium zg-ZJ1578]|uniref:hypothetical protein n=1 Tax=Aerococcaceae bacterium zg-252 TaxID=2796928 RepID=UPI001A23C0F8|nr:hypothetical protein [Aerococcaceae bacterium zg-1578]